MGAGRYLDDLHRDGIAHLGLVRSSEAHARIVKVAMADALAMPGVLAVWVAGDLPEIARPLVSAVAERRRGYTMPVLAGDLARYVGESAVVVADTPARLADAPIEPRGVLTYRDGESGALVVSSSTQNPYRVCAKARA